MEIDLEWVYWYTLLPRRPRPAGRRSRDARGLFRLEDLGLLIRAHGTDDSITRALVRILRAERWGLTILACCLWPPTPPKGFVGSWTQPTKNALSRSAPTSITAGFDELMPQTLAMATVDRLLHHAHVSQTSGDSVRLTQAFAGKGVTRLN